MIQASAADLALYKKSQIESGMAKKKNSHIDRSDPVGAAVRWMAALFFRDRCLNAIVDFGASR